VSGEFGAAYWEDRYRSGEGAGRRAPTASLVQATHGLPPGRALDAGCGRGADALWLAEQGWRVTAVDVSATAVDRAREDAGQAGPEVAARLQWVVADLGGWDPQGQEFDLVTCSYVHVPGPPEELFGRLASWVAPGGTLHVTGHGARHDHGHGHGHGRPAHAVLRPEHVTAVLPQDAWEVVVGEQGDVVVHATRR
jgi:SAM-dependent methyltransferase